MDTIEGLKRQIGSAEELMSVVKTMKSLAAVNIRQYEKAADSVAGYQRTVEMGVRAMLRSGQAPLPMEKSRELHVDGRSAVVLIGTDQGMCGPVNERVFSHFQQTVGQHMRIAEPRFLVVGERIAMLVEDAGWTLHETRHVPDGAKAIAPLVGEILLTLDQWSKEHNVRQAYVYYTSRESRASSAPADFQLLPADPSLFSPAKKQPWPTNQIPLVRADRSLTASALMRQYLFVSLFRALADSLAAENAGRLAAMQGAENNVSEWLGELTSRYHQTRQSVITGELLDIVTGFEALKEDDTKAAAE